MNDDVEKMEELLDELLSRSVQEIVPSKDMLKKELLSGKKLRFYIGTDPTGTSLHLGHATNYIKLEKFRQLGHKVIFLVGDFTARIGDPTDKTSTRVQLTREQVVDNTKTWLKQLAPIVNLEDKKNPVEVVYNHDWLSKMNFEDVIQLASNFTVQQMLERDMFEKRLKEEKPIYVHEFFYPLMQGYDSVHLDVDVEFCGNDQKFNALVGRTLVKRYKNKEKFAFITTLLENPITKEKMMSKSLGTGVFLDASPQDMFGGIMAQPDENIPQLFTDCTYVSLEEISNIKKSLDSKTVNPRDVKMQLAHEITKIYHGEKVADQAKESFVNTFSNSGAPTDIEEIKVSKGDTLSSVLVSKKIVESNSEFKRLVTAHAINIVDGEEITDFGYKITKDATFKIGKRRFVSVKL